MASNLPTQIAAVLSPDQITLLRAADDFGRPLSPGERRELVARGLATSGYDGVANYTTLNDAGREILRSARLAVRAVAR